ncbi:hypothetical protein SDC9_133559 [bioreactor metagenome]|uniref:Uncharacterized protein n=1 Tax=bioreactor metagenome TaxID=1076179 RepID=A0A645DAJ5_9ZZZZ
MTVAQHIGQLAHLLGIGNGLVEGDAEIVGAQNRQIRIVGLQVLIAVTVDHRQIVVVVLLRDKASGVLAEGPDLVLKRPGIANQFGLIQHPVHHFHDLVAYLHPNADVHRAGCVSDIVFGAELFQPVRTAAARGHNGMLCNDLLVGLSVGNGDAFAYIIFQNNVGALVAEQNLHTLLQQILFDGKVQALRLLRPQVADGAVHQLQARLNGVLADLLALGVVAKTLDMLVGAEVQIDLVSVVDGLLSQILSDQGRQIAAHLIGKRQLSIGKCSRAGKAGGNVAVGLAVHTVSRFVLGAVALFHALSLLHHNDLLLAALLQHFKSGKNTGGACANHHNVCVHYLSPYLSGSCYLTDSSTACRTSDSGGTGRGSFI